jgi:hypothetical protein
VDEDEEVEADVEAADGGIRGIALMGEFDPAVAAAAAAVEDGIE